MESGKYIDGRYKIKHILGSGGMANVFLATDLILERDVAIKVLRYDFKDDQQSIRRFHREATASTELVHPNIVPIYDIGGDEYPYIVMEYVEGPNLMEYINDNHPIAYRKVIAIMQEILSGVTYAHSKGVIHRDLKPQNILMNKKGQAMITDFGIAVALTQQSITQTNSVLGSVQYIAPEQAKGSIASNESDIYSLGIILYQLLTNQLPFDGESAVSIALKHFQEPMPSIRELDPNIPQALENVVLKATAKDPQQRYSSAKDMGEDLRTSISPERYNETMFVESSEDLDKVNTIPLMSNSKMAIASESAENKDDTPYQAAVIIDDEEDQTGTSEDKVNKKKEKPKRKRPWIWIIVIILLALLVIFGGVYYASLPADVSVPDLEGMMYEEVESVLSEYELEIGEKIDEPSEEYEENMVIRSNPSSGDTVKEGATVDVYVSTGDPFVDFPDVIGENYDEIRAALTEQGFTVEREDTQSSEYGVGDITDQSITEGTEVRPSNTSVTLTVSTGLPTFTLRDMSNLTLESVENYADEMGLSVTSSTAYHDTVPDGQVISQSPEAGGTVAVGDEISVVISDGPEDTTDTLTVGVTIPYLNTAESEEEMTTSSSEESSEDGSSNESSSEEETETTSSELVPNDIVIYIEDATHSLDEPYRTLRITNDTTVQLEFNLEEDQNGRYRIERNGSIIEESVITN